MLVWARLRAGMSVEDLARRFPRIEAWERGEQSPTLKQLEGFATATHTPVGYLFLPEPPEERVPVSDYRTMRDVGVRRPSPDLLDTIFQCQQRQDWYREYAQLTREEEVTFVGSMSTSSPIGDAAEIIRGTLRFGVAERGSTWTDALRHLIEHAEDAGVLVMVSGVVGSDTHRRLDPHEFRGFALVDGLAPLIFINGADTKAAQIFTLVHELAHLFLGEAWLDDLDPRAAQGGLWSNGGATRWQARSSCPQRRLRSRLLEAFPCANNSMTCPLVSR
jgi:transcriptional regulator with XRE-family HTH domain